MIGIKGTACFLNVEPFKACSCSCYGKTVLRTADMCKECIAIRRYDHELRQLEGHIGGTPCLTSPDRHKFSL